LIFHAPVAGGAAKLGVALQCAGNADDAVRQVQTAPFHLCLVDLDLPDLDLATLVKTLRAGADTPPAIVAYGPHVHSAKLDAARQAGCDEVLTRGQFHKQVNSILQKYCESRK
jgi:CheY-like chemotaxis protein